MNWGQVFLIYKNTLQKEIRSKILLFLIIVTIGFIAFLAQVLHYFKTDGPFSEVGLGALGNSIILFLVAVVGLWNFFLAVFLGVNTVRTDRESGVLPQLLSFPIKRFEYLISRLLGVFTIVTSLYFFSVGLGLWALSFHSGTTVDIWPLLAGLSLNSLSLLAVIALAMSFSLHFGKLVSLFLTFLLIGLVTLSNSYLQTWELIGDALENLGLFSLVGLFLHILLPHLGTIGNMAGNIMVGQEISVSLWQELGHYIFSLTFLFFCTAFLFSRKEI